MKKMFDNIGIKSVLLDQKFNNFEIKEVENTFYLIIKNNRREGAY